MNAEQTMLEAFKRRPAVEKSTWYKGILVSHLATEKDTGGAFDLVMSRMRSGTEPPPLLIAVSERQITSVSPTIYPEAWSSFPRSPFRANFRLVDN
jgi:hypothetical protein